MNRTELIAWLDREPEQSWIKTNDDGSEYIDISTVEDLLSELDLLWGTEDFKFRVIESNGRLYGSASVVLTLSIFNQKRRITGAATLMLGEDITHSEPTLLSECIKNSAKKMGRLFGKYLNDRGTSTPIFTKKKRVQKEAVKIKPDKTILEKYQSAYENGDTETMNKLSEIYVL